MDDAFRSLGFAKLCKTNISSEEMQVLVKSVIKYSTRHQPYTVAFVFSGHGKHKREKRKGYKRKGDVVCGDDGEDIWLNDKIVKPLAAVD